MKKTLLILAVVLIAALVLTACTNQSDKPTDIAETISATTNEKQVIEKALTNNTVTEPTTASPDVIDNVNTTNAHESAKNNDNTKPDKTVKNNDNSVENIISKQQAKEAVLKHARLNENEIVDFKIEIDKEKKALVYEIEFHAGKYEYEYEINAENGNVIKANKEPEKNNEKPAVSSTLNINVKISKDEAKAFAVKHAGVNENDVKLIKAELDKERSIVVYEIEFISGKYEYEYEIDANNGKVLKAEKEIRD